MDRFHINPYVLSPEEYEDCLIGCLYRSELEREQIEKEKSKK